jgi:hypothetical protein
MARWTALHHNEGNPEKFPERQAEDTSPPSARSTVIPDHLPFEGFWGVWDGVTPSQTPQITFFSMEAESCYIINPGILLNRFAHEGQMEKIDRTGLLQFFQRITFYIGSVTLLILFINLGNGNAIPLKDCIVYFTAPVIFCGIQIYAMKKVGFQQSFAFIGESITSPHAKRGGGPK